MLLTARHIARQTNTATASDRTLVRCFVAGEYATLYHRSTCPFITFNGVEGGGRAFKRYLQPKHAGEITVTHPNHVLLLSSLNLREKLRSRYCLCTHST